MFKAITNSELREKIVEFALKQHYKAYKHGSHGPDTFDCAGFVWYVYKEIMNIDIYKDGYGESTTTKIMTSSYGSISVFNFNKLEESIRLLNKGDIVLIHRQDSLEIEPKIDNKYPGHCGIYIGNKKIIHATTVFGHVAINRLNETNCWTKKLIASKNVIKD